MSNQQVVFLNMYHEIYYYEQLAFRFSIIPFFPCVVDFQL